MIGIEGVPEPGQALDLFEASLLLPVPGLQPNTILFEPRDGTNIERLTATHVEFSIAGKPAFNLRDAKVDVFITDARVAFACSKYDKGGGWIGGPAALAVNAGSKALAAIRRRGKMLVGQARYPWIGSVGCMTKMGWTSAERVYLASGLAQGRPCELVLKLPNDASASRLAAEITRRAARYRLEVDREMNEEERSAVQALTQAAPLRSAGKMTVSYHRFPRYWFIDDESARFAPRDPQGSPIVEAREVSVEGDTMGDADTGDNEGEVAAGALGAPPAERLGRGLFERDQDAYIKLAGSMSSDSDPSQLPKSLQPIINGTINTLLSFFDPKMKLAGDMTPLAGSMSHFYAEVTMTSYVLATAEEWEGFEAAEFNRLLTECLPVQKQSACADENIRAVLGVIGRTDDYAPLAQYVNSQPANARLDEIVKSLEISPGDRLDEFMRRDETVLERTTWAARFAWTSGVMLALLERAGRSEEGATALGSSSPAGPEGVAVDTSGQDSAVAQASEGLGASPPSPIPERPARAPAGSRHCIRINCEAHGTPTDLPECEACGSPTQLI